MNATEIAQAFVVVYYAAIIVAGIGLTIRDMLRARREKRWMSRR